MKLLIGTANKGKIIDMSEVLKDLPLEIMTPLDLHISESPQETGDTFEENARQKARFYREKSGLPTLADDSGIIVEALAGELGIHTRRWGAGAHATDEEWIRYFMERMKHEENRRALFVCSLCYIDEQGQEHFFDGTCEGVITEELEADYLPGLPIAACFKPDGADEVYSAMGIEGKNEWSHRGRAMIKLHDYLKSVQT
jgi:XTP/dITP diphosphohydrolase